MSERRLRLYRSAPHGCGYLEGLEASSLFVDPDAPLDAALYARLLALGFRRSGGHVYRPACTACQACVPVRIPVARYRPDRAQRRCLRANHDLQLRRVRQLDAEMQALYHRYQALRHPGGAMDTGSDADMLAFLLAPWPGTEFWAARLDDELVSVSVVDRVPGALSAVYSFFEPTLARRSLGRWSVLQMIATAAAEGLAHVYLGYWIADCRKMRYKAEYRPQERWDGQRWIPVPARDPGLS